MLAPWVMHMGRTPDEIGSGIWVKLIVLALMGAGMPIPEGGSEMLVRALAQLVADQGGVIRTNTQVSRIIVEQGRASKVRTSSNEEFQARQAIVASTNPDQLYLSLLAETDVDLSLRMQAKQFRYGRGCIQIQLALRDLATHTGARTTWPKAISSALYLANRVMLLQYLISLCWEQQRGRDMELMVDRATLSHIRFSTPSEEGGPPPEMVSRGTWWISWQWRSL